MLIENTAKEIKLTENTQVELGDILVEEGEHYLILETQSWEYGFIKLDDSTIYEGLYESIEDLIKNNFDIENEITIIRRNQAKLTIT